MSSPNIPHPLPRELVEILSERMALLGDPTRIRILDQLRGGERNVQSIADALMTTQQNVSGHLRLLLAAGREVFYRASDETAFDVWGRLVAGLQETRRE